MPVHVKEINVQNLGPVGRFSMKLGLFNLIFGRNERGKTYLVEFLIRSLFRSSRQWKLRAIKGSGKVGVEGLRERRVDFSPSSSLKMEDFWEKGSVGLPPDFSRLLVVKGAETELTDKGMDVNKAILKRYLSSKEILDYIEKRISPTIQKCQVQDGVISGPNMGEKKVKNDLELQLKDLNQLFDQIDKGYSGGKRKTLSKEKERLEHQLSNLVKAKCYLAYKVSDEMKVLESEKNLIDVKKLQDARDTLSLYRQRIIEYRRKKEEQKMAEEGSKHYEWLKKAKELYDGRLNKISVKPQPLFWILSVFAALSAFACLYFRILIGAAAAMVCASFLIYMYIRKINARVRQIAKDDELRKLRKEFQNRIGKELTGLPLIEEILDKISGDFNKNQLLKDQLSREFGEMESKKQSISDQLFHLTGEQIGPDIWDEKIRQLEIKLRDLETQIHEKDKLLTELKVAPSDYVTETPNLEYSEQKYEKFQRECDQIKEQIEEENRKLDILKQRICDKTGDDFITNWETIIENLREKRHEILNDYKKTTAEILGKKMVHRVLEDLRKEEDAKIVEGLKSKAILDPLYRITKRYTDFKLEGEKLVVSDSFNDFNLSELSTGAQEQVLLALRIGFSTQLMKKDSLFLILDDAFQYSDWERRVWLMDMVVNLAQNGWQIIYFTMDDHIKKLFDSKGKVFGDQYKHSALDSQS